MMKLFARIPCSISTLLFSGFVLLIPFENQGTGLRTLFLWTAVVATVVEFFKQSGRSPLRHLTGWGALIAVLMLFGGTVIWAAEVEGRVEILGDMLRRSILPMGAVVSLFDVYRMRFNPFDRARPTRFLEIGLWTGLLLWTFWMFAACCYSYDPEESFSQFYKEGGAYLAAAVLATLKLREAAASETALRGLIATAVLVAVISVSLVAVAYVGSDELRGAMVEHDLVREHWSPAGELVMIRGQYPFDHHNRSASYLMVGLLLIPLAWAYGPMRKLASRRNIGLTLAALLIFAGIMVSGTRGAMVAAGGGLMILALGRPKFLGLLAVAGVVVFLAMPTGMRDQALTIFKPETYRRTEGNIHHRVQGWTVTRMIIEDRPVLGFGYGWTLFEDLYSEYNTWQDIENKPHAHNNLMEITSEMGLVGLACFSLYHLALLIAMGRVLFSGKWGSRSALIALAALSLWAGIHAFGMVNYSLRRSVGFEIWIAWALIHAIMISELNREPDELQTPSENTSE